MTPEVHDAAYGFALGTIYDRLYALTADTAACVDALADGTAIAAEYGIGTGRIAVPLARRGIEVSGVDLSTDFLSLAAASAAASGVDLDLHQGDMSTWQPAWPVDLAFSVCASLTMLPSQEAVAATVQRMASSLRPGGRVVIENHHPDHVRRLCANSGQSLQLQVADLPGGVTMTPQLGDGWWTALLAWNENGTDHEVLDRCRLIEPDRLAELAADAGLVETNRSGGWTGQPLTANDAVHVSTFRLR